MGQKVNPISFRLGFNRSWDSQWFSSKKGFGDWLLEDLKLKQSIKKKFYHTGIPKILVERRTPEKVRLIIYTARPGLIVGRRGAEIDRLREELRELVNREVVIEIREVKIPELEAQLVAENIALQLERRVSFRRAIKRSMADVMARHAEGIRVVVSGRLGGAEMSRYNRYQQGKIPLQTLRADIDYGVATAFTTYGTIGVKVWVCRGEKLMFTPEDSDGLNAKKG